MKKIKVKFIGFWAGFSDEDNIFINALKKHFDVELSDEPEYLFYSTFLPNEFDFALYDCVRIFFSGENASPDFNYCDYAISFDSITYNDRYLEYKVFTDDDMVYDALHKHENISEADFAKRENFCNFIVGNSTAMPERKALFDTINEYKTVSSAGTYLNNTGFVADNYEKKLAFQRTCRFSVTCESVSQCGFVTEKILHAFAAGTVPVYYGDSDVTKIFNPKAFINCHDFDSFDDVIKEIDRIENNPPLWAEMVSAPAFLDGEYIDKKHREFEAFLFNIMNQDYEKAFRRPLKYHAVRYADAMKEYMEIKSNIRYQRFEKCQDNFFVRLALKLFSR